MPTMPAHWRGSICRTGSQRNEPRSACPPALPTGAGCPLTAFLDAYRVGALDDLETTVRVTT